MSPLLILREEIVCLIVLFFLVFISRSYRMGKDGKLFDGMVACAITHAVLDAVTVWTVNHQECVPPIINITLHIAFYMTAMLYSTEFFLYVLKQGYPKLNKKWDRLLLVPAGIYLLLVSAGVLKIDLSKYYNGTYSSSGSAPIAGFALCFVYFIVSLAVILVKRKTIGRHIKLSLIPMLLVMITVEIVQVFVPEFLFTGGAVTAITVGFFFTLENPAAVLERKVMMDALSGLRSRSSYEHDLLEYEKEFGKDRSIPFTFVFMDISNLRAVNGVYGHQEGDGYITETAVLLVMNMKAATHIYRMGGDEFLAIYRETEEETVIRDIRRVHDACAKQNEKKPYRTELAVGYAISNSGYTRLRDVLRVADYMMYRNKADLKREAAIGARRETGTHLNLSGLTDRVYDAMCLTGDRYYPFLTNMETGVTRLSPAMVAFFQLENEFVDDFEHTWTRYIHPDDLEGYERDLHETLRGAREYHYYKYRAKAPNGEYVDITCRGGVYHGQDGEADIFCGYMVNHGAPEVVDPATGLRNHTALHEVMNEAAKTGCRAAVMKLDTRNIAHIRMLYGSAAVSTITRELASVSRAALYGKGEVFSRNGGYLMFFLPGYSREEVNALYQDIRKQCVAGFTVDNARVPVAISAGAAELPAEQLKDADTIRSAAQYAAEEAWNTPADTVVFYHTEGGPEQEGEMSLLKTIHMDCLGEREHFFLRFQPIFQSVTGRLTGAEALLRWKDETYGEVPPGSFIGFLENDPAYMTLGYDIIRMAVRQAGHVRKTIPDFNINVNITATQLYEKDFVYRVTRILDEEKYPAEHLILELTERCKQMEFSFLKDRVERLRKTGIRVALDDIGTGFSTLDLLLHLRVDEVKMDMAFTQELEGNSNNELIAQAMCRMAEKNGMYICFEGVETAEMKTYLERYGNILVQGYHFDRPLTAAEFNGKYLEA